MQSIYKENNKVDHNVYYNTMMPFFKEILLCYAFANVF